jgi:hypothetical protein
MIDRAFVLGPSGVSGAGMMTLTRRLSQDYPRADILRYDDYQTVTRMPRCRSRA